MRTPSWSTLNRFSLRQAEINQRRIDYGDDSSRLAGDWWTEADVFSWLEPTTSTDTTAVQIYMVAQTCTNF
jgi:hypothetical protein